MKGERGSILGRWTANLPGEFRELIFRPDGQFRLNRCHNNELVLDYGLFTVDLSNRALVYDSRFAPVETRGLDFYGDTLGIKVTEEKEGGVGLTLGDTQLFLYPKEDHEPASFTVLNIAVTDIDAAVAELGSRGIEFESYGGDIETDENGIFRGADQGNGPNIAWFKDPSGNILSVIEK